ncbi:hypothetical protein HHK36_009258 [Tetracentron sinense]|uniref:ENTH domain-containing protein n=1 Tax=Tetracentron sinense TaxID=13715 RepID=A0A834ZCN0_TETSI|nr:hypothetical protein HHK36_009258 [Tetracentron sinense]
MAPSKIRKALGAVKDKTTIGLAKVSSSNAISDLDVAIVKATRHDEYPAEEKHIREILSLTSYSPSLISSCIRTLSKRLNKTRNWRVALKTLMLIHRLIVEGDSAYEQEIFFATSRGTRLLNMSDFRDKSQTNSWDYSAFVRTYALYIDERLEFRMHGRRGRRFAPGNAEDEETGTGTGTAASVQATPVREMNIVRILTRTQHLQQLLERFLACRPTDAAKNNQVVLVALYPIVKESFQLYYDITEIMGILIDRFMELEVPDCVKVYEIFNRMAKQFDELDMFYSWCKTVGITRSSQYPEVERIPSKKLEVMDEFIRDKSTLAHSKRARSPEQKNEIVVEEVTEPEAIEENTNEIKALPPPEGFGEVTVEEEKDEMKQENNTQQEADLLNLQDDEVTSEEQGDKLGLALFDGGAASETPAWEAFPSEDSADWETALVQSASNLSNPKAALGGGLDMLLLDGMYQKSATMAGGSTGSASSVAFGSAGKPAMLALPEPPVSGSGTTTAGADPFEASLAVEPPAYVQMSELEKKQKLLVEEQLMWKQYAREGMQGQLPIGKLQINPYTMGGYT